MNEPSGVSLVPKEIAARKIVEKLVRNGYQALYAGGYVRDMLLGLEAGGDVDIATNASPETITGLFPRTVSVGEQFGVTVVVCEGVPFEVATFRSDQGIADGRHPGHVVFTDAREDALRRDFTINGMFFDPLSNQVLDYVGGREDLQKKVVRAIGDPALRFEEDYLRLVRAIRFAARFEFTIEDATWNAIAAKKEGIRRISAERILQELDKMLTGPHPDRAIELLHRSGLLAIILPEVETLSGVKQPEKFHPEGDVFVHTIKALSLLSSPSLILAWSVLLHDIGKPPTMQVTDRIRFHNHNLVGARMAEELLRRLKAPVALIEAVTACIENHMNFMNVTKMRLSTLKKFLSRPTLEDELELHRVDCLASHGDIENYHFLKRKQTELPVHVIKPEPLLRGQDLIDLGLKPGPVFGTLLKEAYDLQLEDAFADKEAALDWLKGKISNR
jgi:poly(A) polymerase